MGADIDQQEATMVTVEFPLAALDADVYQPNHVEVRLSPKQGEALRRVFDGLQRRAARLDNGRFIQRPADVVRWVLEAVQRKLDAE